MKVSNWLVLIALLVLVVLNIRGCRSQDDMRDLIKQARQQLKADSVESARRDAAFDTMQSKLDTARAQIDSSAAQHLSKAESLYRAAVGHGYRPPTGETPGVPPRSQTGPERADSAAIIAALGGTVVELQSVIADKDHVIANRDTALSSARNEILLLRADRDTTRARFNRFIDSTEHYVNRKNCLIVACELGVGAGVGVDNKMKPVAAIMVGVFVPIRLHHRKPTPSDSSSRNLSTLHYGGVPPVSSYR